ncbi:FadD3 family acyl-CoA ligase [Halomonas sp. PR-M31]|uniref:FadD3 family acyl-CoA ligase n=1 Tax=Halomonas sp. PR-M31 TaxID=1471202 RepID=UPI0006517481|nr:FadD3 family acyl-CoA ligase [Halomonas sp. PR-M31]
MSEQQARQDAETIITATSIPELVMIAAERFSGITALEGDGQAIDYADLPHEALAVARALMAQGIDKGDRVAVWAPNISRWVLAALGIHFVGAVLVPINTRMKGAEAADVLERSGARALFLIGDFLDTDYPAMLEGRLMDALTTRVLLNERRTGPAHGLHAWEAFLATGQRISEQDARARAREVESTDLSDLLFTSGTTGKPKGVMSAHGQNLRAFAEYARIVGLQAGDRYLVVNPFFHAFGYKAGWLTCLLSGATILPQTLFDAEAVFERIERDRITMLPGPPTLYLSLLAHPRLKSADLSSLRIAVTGASTIPPVLIERMREKLGFKVVTTAYGLTECGGLATICDPGDDAQTIATTSGKAIAGTEVAIFDESGRRCSPGEAGEICLRGFHVMQGYFENPGATTETIDAEGWLHTGDVGILDEAGNLRITDRLKDMFIVGGFNCYPAEIEAALAAHPAIAQSAVVGVPDERLGEVGCAYVVLMKERTLDEATLIAWARRNMANYKVPRHIRFLETLPVNAANKVNKVELRQSFCD